MRDEQQSYEDSFMNGPPISAGDRQHKQSENNMVADTRESYTRYIDANPHAWGTHEFSPDSLTPKEQDDIEEKTRKFRKNVGKGAWNGGVNIVEGGMNLLTGALPGGLDYVPALDPLRSEYDPDVPIIGELTEGLVSMIGVDRGVAKGFKVLGKTGSRPIGGGTKAVSEGAGGGRQVTSATRGQPASDGLTSNKIPEKMHTMEISPEAWQFGTGVRFTKVDGHWIKEVNPGTHALARRYGKDSLDAQAQGLDKLGDMAPAYSYKSGRMVTADAGSYQPWSFWETWEEGSKRLGTRFNDIRPRNIGSNGIIFDPALHPWQAGIYYGSAQTGRALGYMGGILWLSDKSNKDK